MACNIVYKGNKYSEEEFRQYIKDNISEFRYYQSEPLTSSVTPSNPVFRIAVEDIPTDIRTKIANKYFDTSDDAVAAEVKSVLFGGTDTFGIRSYIEDAYIRQFSTVPATELERMDGITRDIYNSVTKQNTSVKLYPDVGSMESAFLNEDGSWTIKSDEDLLREAKEGLIDVNSDDSIANKVSDLVIAKSYRDSISDIDYSKVITKSEQTELTKKLFNVLEKLGFSTLKLGNYVENYKAKNGVDPSVKALADIANRVVAIAEGENIDELLSEEVAHVLTETYNNQDEIRAVLPEVENTQEWADHADTYFAIYGKNGIEGDLLVEKVRREILGKIIANKISTPKVDNIVTRFFSSIKNLLTSSKKKALTRLTDKIADSIIEEDKIRDLFSGDNASNSLFSEFYNASDSHLTEKFDALLSNSRKLVSKNRGGNLSSKVEGLAESIHNSNDTSLTDEEVELEKLKAVSKYIDIVNSIKKDVLTKVNRFDEAKKRGNPSPVFLGAVEAASINVLMTESLPHLQTLSATLPGLTISPDHQGLKTALTTQLTNLISEVNKLKGEVEVRNASSVKTLVDTLTKEYGYTESATDKIKNYQMNKHRDIGVLQMFFGNLQNSSNIVLETLGRIISNMTHKTDVGTKNFVQTTLSYLKSIGIDQSNLGSYYDKIIQRDSEGKITGFLNNVIDWGRFTKAETEAKVEAYNKGLEIYIDDFNNRQSAAGRTATLTFEPITALEEIGSRENAPLLTSFRGEAKKVYNKFMNDWNEENREYPHTQSFRVQRENMIADIEQNGITLPDGTVVNKIPEQVLEMMSGWATERRRIKAPYTSGNIVDYSAMSEFELQELEALKKDRQEAKSIVSTTTGELKTGRDMEIALAFQAIEQYYINANKSGPRGLRQEFLATLNSFSTPQEAFEWFNRNAGISFTPEFWDSIRTNSDNSIERFTKALESGVRSNNISSSQKDDIENNIETLKELQLRKSNFLKQFRNSLNPAETDFDSMSDGARELFRELEEQIEKYYSDLNSSLKPYLPSAVVNPLQTESTSNESFDKAFAEARLLNPGLTLVQFAQKHMTRNNLVSVSNLQNDIKYFKANGKISSTATKRIASALKLGANASANDVTAALVMAQRNGRLDELVDNYAKSKLSGYFKRFAPVGFTDIMRQVESGTITDLNGNTMGIAEFLTGLKDGFPSGLNMPKVVEFMQINPEMEWLEDTSKIEKNENYIETTNSSRHYGGYGQPKFDKYKNTEFIDRYNIDEDLYKKTGNTETRGTDPERKKELDLINMFVQTRYNNLKAQGLEATANSYSLPGVRKTSVEKTVSFFKDPVHATKEWVKDNVENSVDKKLYGETASGEINTDPKDASNLVVPTLNVNPLEDLQDTSTDLLHSYTVHTYNALLYQNRQEALSKANQLETLLLSKDFENKSAINSNSYKAFQDFKKAYLLGVQETARIKVGVGGKTIDLTNILRGMDRALGTVNVGLNPAVSITAASSAATFSFTEALVGQYINPSSLKKGMARFHANVGSYLGETGHIDKTNEITLFGERFGLYNAIHATENSGQNAVIRGIMSEASAHILTEIATKPFAPATMYGVMHDMRLVEGKLMSFNEFKAYSKGTKSEIRNRWDALEKKSVLNNIKVKDGKIEYSSEFNDYFNSIPGGQTVFEETLRNKISTLISRIDAKMPQHDKSMASRNALAKFLLRHREWFTINFQNRFKSRHENLYTNQIEEGSYVTMGKFMYDAIQAFNPKNSIKIKDVFDSLSDTEKINLRRVFIDTSISAILLAIGGLVVAPWDDDEDNKDKYAVQFLSYMYYRLASEQMSSGLLGVPSYKDVLESPFVAMNSVKEVLSPNNWSTKEVESGAYEGHSKLFKMAAKNTFLRHYFDLVHGLDKKSDFYRLNNQWTLLSMQKISKKEKEAQEKYQKELEDTYINSTERFVR